MGKHIYYLNRIINEEVMSKLAELIFNEDLNKNVETSLAFKGFIYSAFNVKREARPSVSQLSDIFRKYGCKKPGSLAVNYAKNLEELAYKNKIKNFMV